jgi:signal transduction histidine kinase
VRPVEEDHRSFPRILSSIGATVITAAEIQRLIVRDQPLWVVIATIVASTAWVLASFSPLFAGDRVRIALLAVPVVVGSYVACVSDVVALIPALAGVAALISRPQRSIAFGAAAAVVSLGLIGAGGLLVSEPEPLLLSSIGSLVIAVLVGLSRRQYRAAEQQSRLLLEEKVVVEQGRAEVAALAERSRIARDIHDVLAHSLGGLVLQLDAVEALLESGRTDEAARRVAAARGLAGEGLEEARRAVDALRDPEAAADPAAAIEQLIETHRSLGARAELHESGRPAPLDPEAAGALRRAAQEVLSNARRHAPGMPTELSLEWTPRDVAFRASTTLPAASPAVSAGGGRGLTGLQERMVALGGTATAGVQGRAFVVEAHLPVKATAA